MANLTVAFTKRFQDRHPLNTATMRADAAGTYYADISSLFRLGQMNMGIQFQAHGATVTPSVTMVPATEAKDEIDNGRAAGLPWHAGSAISTGTIQVIPVMGTFVQLVFAGPGAVYIGVA